MVALYIRARGSCIERLAENNFKIQILQMMSVLAMRSIIKSLEQKKKSREEFDNYEKNSYFPLWASMFSATVCLYIANNRTLSDRESRNILLLSLSYACTLLFSLHCLERSPVLGSEKKEKASGEIKLHRFTRSVGNNTPFDKSTFINEVLDDFLTLSLRICPKRGKFNVCPRGMPGPPGRAGPKGDKGDRGRRGRKGSQGVMGQPGRSGKQGVMGPPGIRGEKGIKGDTGAPVIPGMKGEPGESIFAPKVTVSTSQLTVNESTTASLLCSASGNPASKVAWSRVNGTLPRPSNRTKVTEGLMQIKDVRLEDAGKYKCMARNFLGKDEDVASLVVQSKSHKYFL